MSLYKRIHEQGPPPEPDQSGPVGTALANGAAPAAAPAVDDAQPGTSMSPGMAQDVINELRQKAHHHLVEQLGPVLYDKRMSAEDLHARVRDHLQATFQNETGLDATQKLQLIQDITDDVLGYGPIDRFLNDDDVSEVMVNGPDRIFIEKNGMLTLTDGKFIDGDHVQRIIEKIVNQIGRRCDEKSPMVDARLPDGSRVNAIIPPLAIDGPFLTIRKFSKDPFQVDDLIRFGTLNAAAARFIQACIVGRLNVIVSGGTGTGKTTTLNVLSSFIPGDERICTIEDAKELQLHQEHVLCMETRPPDLNGEGAVTIRDLVKNSLRMRPDRVVVGECRSGEALDMLQAMNTGHDGSLTTVHSNGPRDTLSRIETMTMMAGYDLPAKAIREQMASAIDLIVHLTRLKDGTRRITHITEVQGMEGDVITLQDIFLFDFGMGVDEHGKYRGHLKATGVRPKFTEKLADNGIKLGPEVFATEGMARSKLH